MISLQKINSKVLSRQSGVRLVELMIAMMLGVFLMFALVEILINGKQSFGAASQMSRLQENGRISTNLIVSDLKRAGYLGGNSNVDDIFGTTGQITPPTISCAPGDTTWGRMISQPVVGLDDTNAGYACIPNADYLRGDILTVRHALPWIDSGALDANRLYLRSSLFQGKIFIGSAEADPANTIDDPQGQLNVRELQAHAYFVGNSGRSCGGNPVPSLFRVRMDDSGQPLPEELLPGIENLQVQYGISSDLGVNGRYLDADAVTNWDDIVTVRIWLLVRAECSETGFADTATYTMGDVTYTPADDFRRQLYSSVVLIRN